MSSISGNFNSISKLDKNNDSKVTLKELKEVAKKDGNENDLSVKDLESVGITDKNLQKEIIKKYNQVSEFDPNTKVFDIKNNKKSVKSDENIKTQEEPKSKKDGGWQKATEKYTIKDQADNIISVLSGKTYDKMKSDLLKETNNNPKVTELLSKIDQIPNGTLSRLFGSKGTVNTDMKNEMLQYISKLFEKHPGKANEILTSLLNYLNTNASSGALVSNSQKMEFVKDILHDITYPTDIDQREKGTCAATAVQTKLAISDPKKYVQIATKLANGESWNGISPNKTYQNESKIDTRSLSCKIIQNSFMDYANGGTKYDSNKYQDGKKVDETGRGLFGNESENLEEKIFGNSDIDNIEENLFVSKDEILTEIDKSLRSNGPVGFSVDGHAMLILSKNSDNTYNIFTWGEERKISSEDLKKYIIGARIIDDSVWNSY